MDEVIWGNLTYFSAKMSIEPVENFEIGAQYHIFSATEKAGYTLMPGFSGTGTVTGINNPLNGLVTAPGGAVYGTAGAINTADEDIGSEIDLYAVHDYDNGLVMTARYGIFMPGDRIKKALNTTKAKNHQTFFLQGTFKF